MNRLTLFLWPLLALMGCAAVADPLEELTRDLEQYPEYTVILNDYRQEGNFFSTYYQQYKVVVGEGSGDDLTFREEVRDFVPVPQRLYERLEPYLGMAILSKTADGTLTDTPFPPGYQYVGNPQYGSWARDQDGNEFWQFAGQYLLLSTIFNAFDGPRRVYRNDWGGYTTARRSRTPYFGTGNRYGTAGTLTRQSNPTFFERQAARQTASRQSFSNRVNSRVRRSSGSSYRGGSSFSFGGK